MQLDQVTISTRPRSGWSAIDLGIKLALHHYWPCFAMWLILATPFFILPWFLTGQNYWLSYLILWWMKPLYERPLLYILSRELFGQKTLAIDAIKNYKKWLTPGWLAGITYRRISFSRSFYMPITVLEKLKSKEYSQRSMVLGIDYGSQAGWLTVVLYHIEVFFYFGFLGLIELIAPEQIEWTMQMKESNYDYLLTLSLQLVSFALIAPFYVASGFMLYIARRIQLEGWDIELRFRDWMAKYND